MGNPHGYEAGFTIEQHRDELIDRLGLALKEIAKLKADRTALLEALKEVLPHLWECAYDKIAPIAVTHWMPLPAPPTE